MVGMVKNIEHPKLIFSSPKKATNIVKGESPNPSPPRRDQPSQQGGAKGPVKRARITHSLLAIANLKNL